MQDQPVTEAQAEPTDPEAAVELYLKTRKGEVSNTTLRSHEYRLSHFIRWCDERGIDALTQLDGRNLHEYRLWRRDDGDLNTVTLPTQLSTLRVFLKFCESIEVAPTDVHELLQIPTLNNGEDRRDTILDADRAAKIQEWLAKYEYASFDHTLFTLLWRTGMRIGEAKALDVDDYDAQEARLSVEHRPQGRNVTEERQRW